MNVLGTHWILPAEMLSVLEMLQRLIPQRLKMTVLGPYTHVHDVPSISVKGKEEETIWEDDSRNQKASTTWNNKKVLFLIRSLNTCLESDSTGSLEIPSMFWRKEAQESRASHMAFPWRCLDGWVFRFSFSSSYWHSFQSKGGTVHMSRAPLSLSYSPIERDVSDRKRMCSWKGTRFVLFCFTCHQTGFERCVDPCMSSAYADFHYLCLCRDLEFWGGKL